MPFLDYLRHLALAGDEHSLHSPFLFDFYRSVVKGKNQLPEKKSLSQINRLFNRHRRFYARIVNLYFHDATTVIIGEPPSAIRRINGFTPLVIGEESQNLQFLQNISSIDFLIINLPLTQEFWVDFQSQYFPKLREDSMVLIENIYGSKSRKAAWEALKVNSNVRQSLDFYHFGILLFRKKQPKQHFRLQL